MNSLRIFLITVVMVVMATAAYATPYTFTFTADNKLTELTMSVDGGAATAVDLSGLPNLSNWKIADSLTINLTKGSSYDLIWRVENVGTVGPNNPFGFLGDVSSAYGSYSSSATWQVADDNGGTPGTWVNALEYAANSGLLSDGSGANSIWYNNNHGSIAGIAGEAQWIGEDVYPGSSSEAMYVKMNFTATPIPAAAWLLGSGLIGLLGIRHRFVSK
ncbi:MAG: hypothetical protein KKB70_11275 [Proteobacteria bacterium]|nr:hypothetical protein [Pseudomonadota bacterium]MBU1611785.1 hypothetical protein [Pseudomonadota bacterium]